MLPQALRRTWSYPSHMRLSVAVVSVRSRGAQWAQRADGLVGGWGHLCLEWQDEQLLSRRQQLAGAECPSVCSSGAGETLGHSRSGRGELEPGDSLSSGQDKAGKGWG